MTIGKIQWDDAVEYAFCYWWVGSEMKEARIALGALEKVEEEEEYVINYIILLVIKFENLHREQEGKPEMTDEEEEKVRASLSSFSSHIRDMAEAVRNGVVDAGKYLPFIEQVRRLLAE